MENPRTVGARTWISESCEEETCGMCGLPAVAKVGEEIADDDPFPSRHNLTAYVCEAHFNALMGRGGVAMVAEFRADAMMPAIDAGTKGDLSTAGDRSHTAPLKVSAWRKALTLDVLVGPAGGVYVTSPDAHKLCVTGSSLKEVLAATPSAIQEIMDTGSYLPGLDHVTIFPKP